MRRRATAAHVPSGAIATLSRDPTEEIGRIVPVATSTSWSGVLPFTSAVKKSRDPSFENAKSRSVSSKDAVRSRRAPDFRSRSISLRRSDSYRGVVCLRNARKRPSGE